MKSGYSSSASILTRRGVGAVGLIAVALTLWGSASAFGQSTVVETSRLREGRLFYEFVNRLERLEGELRQLRGEIEVSEYRRQQLEQRLRSLEAQLANATAPTAEERPREAAAFAPLLPSAPPSAQEPAPASTSRLELLSTEGLVQGAESGAGVTAQRRFEAADERLRQGDYEGAIDAFRRFLDDYPNSDLAALAHYRLGETYYLSRRFSPAKELFIELGTRYPTSDRLPDAMLRLGFIYEVEQNPAQAVAIYQELQRRYPDTQAAREAEVRLDQR